MLQRHEHPSFRDINPTDSFSILQETTHPCVFAAVSTMIDPKKRFTQSQLLDSLREQVVMAEDMGFEAFWLGEHHFGPHGTGNIPNPILVGADLAARTKRIRIGQLANIAVWWHPLRLAEDIAVLDNLTRGRLEVGFGRGRLALRRSSVPPQRRPPKIRRNRELFEGSHPSRKESLDGGILRPQGLQLSSSPPTTPASPTRGSPRTQPGRMATESSS